MKTQLASVILLAGLAACASNGPGPGGKGGKGGDRGGPKGERAENGMVVTKPYAVLFSEFDLDRDRFVSSIELETGIAEEWQSIEPASGSSISILSFKDWKHDALGHEDVVPGSRRFDRNGDNQISETEFSAQLVAAFQRYDGNKDARLARSVSLAHETPRCGIDHLDPRWANFEDC